MRSSRRSCAGGSRRASSSASRPLGSWGAEDRDYHIQVEVEPAAVGREKLAARVSVVAGDEILGEGLVKAVWTSDTGLSAQISRRVAHYTGQAELAQAVQEGLSARKSGDVKTATAKLARAIHIMKAYPDHDPQSYAFWSNTHWLDGPSAHLYEESMKHKAKVIAQLPPKSQALADAIWNSCQSHTQDPADPDHYRNDLFLPKDSVFEAMTATIEAARQAWPKATIVFIRPRFLAKPGDDLGFNDAFMANLRRQPGAAGVVFLDPIKRLTSIDRSDMLTDDGIHPNQRGELVLAHALLESMVADGFAKNI